MVNGMALTIILISVVATFLAVYLAILALPRRAETLEAKLQRFTALRIPIKKGTDKRDLKQLLTLLGRLTPRRWSERLDLELIRGNIPLKGGEFLVLQGLLPVFFFLIGSILSQEIYVGILLAVVGGALPRIWLKSAQKKKRRQFNNQLADALLVLANSLRSGFSLLQAMEMVSQEMPNPISGEFQLALREMTYGTATEAALIHLSERVGSDVLDLLITAMLIQRQAGGNLAEVLMNIHATIQGRLRIQQEIKTLTAQGRISGYIIAILPFGIAVVLSVINPSYLSVLFTNPIGLAMLAGGLISQFIGFLIIRKIITIEV
ncbi:type II secretion system F family protein [Desulfosporosinus burensis]